MIVPNYDPWLGFMSRLSRSVTTRWRRRWVPWEKRFDETEILDATVALFWERGYRGVSMADLVDELGINRSSLYATYGNKEDLFRRALQRYDRVHRQDWFDALADRFDPVESIRQAFIQVAGAPDGERRLGCLLVNTTLELPLPQSTFADVVQTAFDDTRRFFERQLDLAGRRTEPAPDADSAALAAALMALFLGTRVLARAEASHESLRPILRQLDAMLRPVGLALGEE